METKPLTNKELDRFSLKLDIAMAYENKEYLHNTSKECVRGIQPGGYYFPTQNVELTEGVVQRIVGETSVKPRG